MKAECYCFGNSCERSVNEGKRFNFQKDGNCIVGGGEVNGDIPSCRATKKDYFDNVNDFKEFLARPKENLTGHDKRSIANDHRSGKSHGKHFHQR